MPLGSKEARMRMVQNEVAPATFYSCRLIPLGVTLLITGGCMFGICHDAATTGNCGGNGNIASTGLALMVTGGIIEGVVLCCLTTVACVDVCSSIV